MVLQKPTPAEVAQQQMLKSTAQQAPSPQAPIQQTAQPVTGQQTQPVTGAPPLQEPKKSKWWVWVIIVVSVLIILGAAAYFIFR